MRNNSIIRKKWVRNICYKGDVNIITGVHGEISGKTIIDKSLFEADLVRFGDLPGVKVYNFPDLEPKQITNLLNSTDTTIGGFCNSAACLKSFE